MTDKFQSAAFEKALNELNNAQREAVDQIDGPVLVVAGPGTGKTQIIAARIGNILTQTDTAPQNILCLTYTDAGTIAMRQRLMKFIGPTAYRVNIYTFHAFCNEVIQSILITLEKEFWNQFLNWKTFLFFNPSLMNYRQPISSED